MALENMGIKRPKLVSFGKKEKREAKKKDRRRGRRWRSQDQASQKGMELWNFGMETHLDYEFYEIWHGSLGLYDDYLA